MYCQRAPLSISLLQRSKHGLRVDPAEPEIQDAHADVGPAVTWVAAREANVVVKDINNAVVPGCTGAPSAKVIRDSGGGR